VDFPPEVTVGGDRPAVLKVPDVYDGVTPLPLIVAMHGYTNWAERFDAWWGLSSRVDPDGIFLLLPEGTVENSSAGHRFWNATDACCNRYGSNADDVSYLLGLVDEVSGRFAIDSSRIYLTGHSNGAFMSYRLACEASDRFAAIGAMAGATFQYEGDCTAKNAISVLHVHGNADTLVFYEGNPDRGVYAECPEGYPGAVETAERWAIRAGCDLAWSETGDPIDIVPDLQGTETSVVRYSAGCEVGIEVELWTIEGGTHVPQFGDGWAQMLVSWLLRHRR
jgi:polyhydroxybutyrate depolymerase